MEPPPVFRMPGGFRSGAPGDGRSESGLPLHSDLIKGVDTTLFAFAGISLLLAVTPGPDMAVVTKNALAHGRRGVFLTTTGIALLSGTSYGICALICSALTNTSGADLPPTVTEAPARFVGRGTLVAP